MTVRMAVSNNGTYYGSLLKKPLGSGNEVIVVMGEYAITTTEDYLPVLATFGISTCGSLVVYDSNVRVGGLAHIDLACKTEEAFAYMIRDMEALGAKEYSVWFSPKKVKNEVLKGQLTLLKMRMEEQLKTDFNLQPFTDFSFDTRDGEFYELDMNGSWNDVNNNGLRKRIAEYSQHMRRAYFPK